MCKIRTYVVFQFFKKCNLWYILHVATLGTAIWTSWFCVFLGRGKEVLFFQRILCDFKEKPHHQECFFFRSDDYFRENAHSHTVWPLKLFQHCVMYLMRYGYDMTCNHKISFFLSLFYHLWHVLKMTFLNFT